MKYIGIIALALLLTAGVNPDGEPDTVKGEVWQTVRTINQHWAITEDMDSLGLYIHEDMFINFPGGESRGKKEIIDAYTLYAEYAETISMVESEPLIYLYNQARTAVVTYLNELTVKTTDGKIESFTCRDTYTLVWEEGRWYAVAQQYSFL